MARSRAPRTVDDLLADGRATLPHRPSPAEALDAQARGALLVDIRGDDQRRVDGLIPGAIVLPRNALEWRCDPASPWRHPAITAPDLHIILICDQGYQSSLAAATLQQLGLVHATDLEGGFSAWVSAGMPVITPAAAGQQLLGGSLTTQAARLLADEAVQGRVEVPQRTLAAMLGVQRPSLNKVLKDLERDGLIRIGYSSIEVPDPARLLARA